MSMVSVGPGWYQMHRPDGILGAGGKDWSAAPWVDWGDNPNTAGGRRWLTDVGGLGSTSCPTGRYTSSGACMSVTQVQAADRAAAIAKAASASRATSAAQAAASAKAAAVAAAVAAAKVAAEAKARADRIAAAAAASRAAAASTYSGSAQVDAANKAAAAAKDAADKQAAAAAALAVPEGLNLKDLAPPAHKPMSGLLVGGALVAAGVAAFAAYVYLAPKAVK